MAIELKLKEKHYKKSRFSNKKGFKPKKLENITNDLLENKIKASKNIEMQTQIYKTNQTDIIIPEKENSVTHIVTQKQINSFSILLKFLDRGDINFLQIMTYTIDKKTLLSLLEYLKKNKIKKLQFIITETISFRTPKIYELINKYFKNREDVNLSLCWVHSKILLIEQNNNKYIIDGSGNFSQNALIEHYNIWKSKNLYYFYRNFSDETFFTKKIRKNHEIYKNF